MKIGIIGSGNMGRVLGRLWVELGHDVLFGARAEDQARAAAAGAPHGDNDSAARHGDVVLWSPRGVPPEQVLRDVSLLDGKVVLDVGNTQVPPDYALGPSRGERSLAEQLAGSLPRARVVKAFNTMAQEVFEHSPAANGVSAFLAGDDPEAKAIAARLAMQMGLSPIDCGPLAAARMLEGFADAIRVLMGTLGVYATISVHVLPRPSTSRLGERTATRLP
jgi:8-hydroxy-5-deazaflavin:NADPH oxidoreductase